MLIDTWRLVAMATPLAFARLYMPSRVRMPWSRLHHALAEAVISAGSDGPRRILLTGPDGYGKTTIGAVACPLWLLATGRARHIGFVSATIPEAGHHIAMLNDVIRTSSLMRRDFPGLVALNKNHAATGRACRSITFRSGQRLTALGLRSPLRALARRPGAPDTIIVDNCDPPAGSLADMQTTTPGYTTHATRWVERELDRGCPRALVLVLGSAAVRGDLADAVRTEADDERWLKLGFKAVMSYPDAFVDWFRWSWIHYNALDHDGARGPDAATSYLEEHRDRLLSGSDVLWPELEDLESLMLQRVKNGWQWFDAEKQTQAPGSLGQRLEVGEGATGNYIYTDDAGYDRRVFLAPCPYQHRHDPFIVTVVGTGKPVPSFAPPRTRFRLRDARAARIARAAMEYPKKLRPVF